MQTYNELTVPPCIKVNRIISAFQNAIDYCKVSEYTDIFKDQMLSHGFPPIMGFPSIITDQDIEDGVLFMTGEPVNDTHKDLRVWYVTDGHHRTLAAIEANLPHLEVALDYSTITNENDFKNF